MGLKGKIKTFNINHNFALYWTTLFIGETRIPSEICLVVLKKGEVICAIISLLISIGKLKHTIGMITYRYSCALDSKVKTAFKSFYL